MPKANHASTTSRRAMLAGLASLPAVSVAHAASKNPDAQVVRLCTQYRAVRQEVVRLDFAPLLPFGSPAARAEEALRTELVEASDQLLQKLSETPATSLTGLHAKAQTVLLYLPVYIDEFEAHPEDPEITFIHAFAADVIALAERGLS